MLNRIKKLFENKFYIISMTVIFIAAIILNELMKEHLISALVMVMLSLLAGYNIFWKALIDLRYRIIGIDLLVTIAVLGAFVIGDFFEAAAVTYLFTLGYFLEKRALEKTRTAIAALMDLRPQMARKIVDDKEQVVSLDSLEVDDILLIKQGEKIPTDGLIIEGRATIDEQMISGESLPKDKNVGDPVIGATIIASGYLIIKVTAIGADTTLGQMITLVEDAQDKKAKSQKFIEKFAKFYTPSIVLFALVLFVVTLDVRLAITMLVISCPGALVIATPVSYVAGIGRGARRGILYKGGDSLERLNHAKVIFFDKTGTLTVGKPELKSIVTFEIEENEALRIAAIGEKYSEHPLAKALVSEAKKRHLMFEGETVDPELMIARGITFNYLGQHYQIGNDKIITTSDHKQIGTTTQFENMGWTTLKMTRNNELVAIFALGDEIRRDAHMLIQKLRNRGFNKIMMLTGDEERVARKVAKDLALDGYHASLLPEDKARIVEEYEQVGATIFVGDGINDALALSYASSSVAIGGLGKDLAMASSDVVLLSEELSKLDEAITISKKVKANMYQNVLFALLVVVFLIVGVIFKTVDMAVGMLVHELSVLLVLINAARLIGRSKKNGQHFKS